MIRRREFLQSAVTTGIAARSLAASPPARPNFLFLIADDLTYRAIQGLNNPEIQTPNLNRLVKRGCTFTQCFHQGSWVPAVCVASRTMLNTGLTAFRARARAEQTPLWGETLGAAGYDTSIVGKWHLSDANLKRSFKEIGRVSPGMFESGPAAYNRPSPDNTWTPWDQSLKGQWLANHNLATAGRGTYQTLRPHLVGRRVRLAAEARHTDEPVLPIRRLQLAPRSAAGAQGVRRSLPEKPHRDSAELPGGASLRPGRQEDPRRTAGAVSPIPRGGAGASCRVLRAHHVHGRADRPDPRLDRRQHLRDLHRRPWACRRPARTDGQTKHVRPQHPNSDDHLRSRHPGRQAGGRNGLPAQLVRHHLRTGRGRRTQDRRVPQSRGPAARSAAAKNTTRSSPTTAISSARSAPANTS